MTSTIDAGSDLESLLTRLAAAEARAAQSEAWLDVAFEHSPVAMAIVSVKDNRYVRVNGALERLLGRPRAEILAADPFSFIARITHPDDLAKDRAMVAEMAMGKRQSYETEKRYVRPDGTIRWALVHVSASFEETNTPGLPPRSLGYVVTQAIDVSEHKATAEALRRREEELRHAQRIEGIGRLAGGIAHDFNNLLTVIAGHGELLRDLAGDGRGLVSARELSDNVEAMIGAAERGASLTAQLLAHGRRDTVVRRVFVLSDAVAAMQRLLVRVIGANIEVSQSLLAQGPIYADQGQIGQVVMNLVLNARDAMPEGGRLALATRDVERGINGEDASSWVTLSVSDSGHGMTPEVQARMFEPFFTTRADRPGTQGTGLGLATVQRIVEEARGLIEVQSSPDAGTTVTVLLPRVARRTPIETPRPLAPAASQNAERLLVVEDDAAVRTLVASILVGAHYRVTAARDGEEALRFIDETSETSAPFDLIVTDLMMARIGGVALAKELERRGRSPRVLFISGYSDHGDTDLPAGQILHKPFTPTQLLEAVRGALEAVVEPQPA